MECKGKVSGENDVVRRKTGDDIQCGRCFMARGGDVGLCREAGQQPAPTAARLNATSSTFGNLASPPPRNQHLALRTIGAIAFPGAC